MNGRKALRQLIARDGYTMVPGAYDTLTARLVEQAGFEAVYLTGGGYSRASGYPDLGLLSLTENAMFIARTVEAVGIPVIADADTGYGNAINVIRTVREYEKSGVAGFHIEDQVSPKKCGHYEGKEVISRAEMVGKIKAAVDTRRDADLVIIARSDARAVEGLEAAIERVNAYLEAGADVGFVEAPQTVEELRIVGQKVRGPALVNVFEGGKTPMLGAAALEAMGFRLGIYRRRPTAPRSARRNECWRRCSATATQARSRPSSPPSRTARTRSAPQAGARWKRNICGLSNRAFAPCNRVICTYNKLWRSRSTRQRTSAISGSAGYRLSV
jgi:2-methylisocitrate lyase-like PEP mutase family enzyme